MTTIPPFRMNGGFAPAEVIRCFDKSRSSQLISPLVSCCFPQTVDERDRSRLSDCARYLSARDAKMPEGNCPTDVLTMDRILRQATQHRFAMIKVWRRALALHRFFLAARSCRRARSCKPEKRPRRAAVRQLLRWFDISAQSHCEPSSVRSRRWCLSRGSLIRARTRPLGLEANWHRLWPHQRIGQTNSA